MASDDARNDVFLRTVDKFAFLLYHGYIEISENIMKKTQDFTSGKILSPLIKFAMPLFAALFLQAMYGAVDLAVVGEFAKTADVSAVSTGSLIMQTIMGFFMELSGGICVLVGQKIGKGDKRTAGKAIGAGIFLFSILAVIATALFVGFSEPIAVLMQAPKKAFSETVSYVRICSAGTVFIIAFNVLGSIFRGIGDSKMPLITVAIACVVNIAGDLVLVAVLGMGSAGAAIATVFAQAVSVIISVLIIRKRKLSVEFSLKDIRPDRVLMSNIMKIGLPVAIQDFLVSISFLVIMAIVNSLGLVKSAGVGVAEKICAFIMLIPSAYSQAMSAFVAHNIGAGRPDRARKALWYGISTSLAAGIVVGYLSFFHGDILSSIFASSKPDVIAASASYLKAYAIDCVFTSFLFCFIGYFSGRGNTLFVLVQGLVGAFGVRIPVSYAISRIADVDLFFIGLATPASTVVQITLCLVMYFICKKKDAEATL